MYTEHADVGVDHAQPWHQVTVNVPERNPGKIGRLANLTAQRRCLPPNR